MADMPLARLRALELRYDGPIPAQYHDSPAAARRRRRGVITLLESQASEFLDAAVRCQTEMEELAGEPSVTLQPNHTEARIRALRDRLAGHICAAAEALRQAAALRRELALDPHPLVGISALLTAA